MLARIHPLARTDTPAGINWTPPMTESAPSPEWLAQQYGPLVFKAAYRVLGDASLAEDVQQDVFLKLIESDPAEVGSWPAYLSASAVRAAIDVLRRRQRWWRVVPMWRAQQPFAAASAEQASEERERGQRLRLALAKLPKREAQCFSLRYLECMEIGEIARSLALSENNVNVVLHRARRRLETQLGEAATEIAP
ncbi:RNA polymerase sigma factor, sigma-70 family protein [Lysobacter capsici]|nr:RNA polymerase sigma factor, sigma-70 family protein [Lysobacter capsici]